MVVAALQHVDFAQDATAPALEDVVSERWATEVALRTAAVPFAARFLPDKETFTNGLGFAVATLQDVPIPVNIIVHEEEENRQVK